MQIQVADGNSALDVALVYLCILPFASKPKKNSHRYFSNKCVLRWFTWQYVENTFITSYFNHQAVLIVFYWADDKVKGLSSCNVLVYELVRDYIQ